MDSTLILGDIDINTINGKHILNQSEYIINPSSINQNGIVQLTFNQLQITKPISFIILYNNEIYFPDITWLYNKVQIDFGKEVDNQDIIKLIINQNLI